MKIAVEDPLSPSHALYSLDEASGNFTLAEFSVPGLRRYSFVPDWSLQVEERNTALADVLNIALAKVGHMEWLKAWLISDGARSRGRGSFFRSKGWDRRITEEFILASRPFEASLPPVPCVMAETDLPILCSSATRLVDLLGTTHVFRAFASQWGFAPTRTILTSLRDAGLTVGYFVKDVRGILGFVLVTTEQLPVDMCRRVAEIVVDHPEVVWSVPSQ